MSQIKDYNVIPSFMRDRTISFAEKLQAQMHEFVESITKDNPKISYQDACNVFMLLKISELYQADKIKLDAEDHLVHFKKLL